MRYHSDKHFSEFVTYNTAAKINWYRYGTKLHHCHPVYRTTWAASQAAILSAYSPVVKLSLVTVGCALGGMHHCR